MTPSSGGTYYIKVWSNDRVVDDPLCTLKVDIQAATASLRVTPPNVPSTCRVDEDYTAWAR